MPANGHSDDSARLDLRSYEQVFLRYYSGLIVFTTRLTSNREVAEDIVHDVFGAMWENRDEIRMETVQAYLFSAVRNRSLNYLGQLKKHDEYQKRVLEKGDIAGSLPWDYYVEAELRERIEKVIRELPPQAARVIIMSRMEGKSAQAIADELNLSRRTVEKHIELAVKQLRKRLADYTLTSATLLLFDLF